MLKVTCSCSAVKSYAVYSKSSVDSKCVVLLLGNVAVSLFYVSAEDQIICEDEDF